jgi:GT2 family glycosyltransferase
MNASIIIPSYNGTELLKKSLPSILNAIDLNSGYEIIVVDDGSRDNTLLFLKKHFPQINVVPLKENIGFAKAIMEGIYGSKGKFIILINNDVVVEPNFLAPLLYHLIEKDVFAVGSKVLKAGDKGHYHLRSTICLRRGEIEIIRDKEGGGETFYVSGGMGAYDKDIFLELGGFDDLYHPFYWEDVDLCYRALKKGYKMIYEPRSVIYHKDQGTIVFRKKGKWELFLAKMYARIIQERNQYLFTWKNILDRNLIIKHTLLIPCNLFLSLWGKDHIFKPIGFIFALARLRKALKRRKEEKKKRYRLGERDILNLTP